MGRSAPRWSREGTDEATAGLDVGAGVEWATRPRCRVSSEHAAGAWVEARIAVAVLEAMSPQHPVPCEVAGRVRSVVDGGAGPMGLEGAVRLGYRRELDAIGDPAQRAAREAEMIADAYAHANAIDVASFGELDDVIDPGRDARAVDPRTGGAGPAHLRQRVPLRVRHGNPASLSAWTPVRSAASGRRTGAA